jgi:PAP2 superfamily
MGPSLGLRQRCVRVLESGLSSVVSPAKRVQAHEPVHQLSRASLAANSAATLLVLWVAVVLHRLELPHDPQFVAVIYLMWSSNLGDHWIVLVSLMVLLALTALHATLLMAGALIIPRERTLYWRVIAFARRDALHLAVWLLLALNLSRYVANLIYEVAQGVTWDFTPIIARIEASYIESLQAFSGDRITAAIAAWLYSVGWYVPVLLAGPLAQACGRRGLVERLLLATFLTAVLAIPVFLLFPVFEPWAMNPWYGYEGSGSGAVSYDYPAADRDALRFVATELRWATGACLPSLHVAFPMVYALVFTRAHVPILGAVYWLLAGLTALGVVILGRHWAIDVILALPYAMAVVIIAEAVARRVPSWLSSASPDEEGPK